MYQHSYPQTGDLVTGRVVSIGDDILTVKLLEYNEINGIVTAKELTRKRLKSIKSLIKVGATEVFYVLAVNESRGYLDLSKKNVTVEDKTVQDCRFKKSRLVHSLLTHIATILHRNPIDIMEAIAWKLAKTYQHPYDALVAIRDNPAILEQLDLDEELKDCLLNQIMHKFVSHLYIIRAEFDLTCLGVDGVEAIKEVCQNIIDFCQPTVAVKIRIYRVPEYYLTATVSENLVESTIKVINNALELAIEEIQRFQGYLNIKEPPRLVNSENKKDIKTDDNSSTEDEDEDDEEDDNSGTEHDEESQNDNSN